jgi:ribosomal protein L29
MKRKEYLAHLQKSSLTDLRTEVTVLEKRIQEQKMTLAFGKSKQVSTIGKLKRDLARSLTIANQKLTSQPQTAPAEDK